MIVDITIILFVNLFLGVLCNFLDLFWQWRADKFIIKLEMDVYLDRLNLGFIGEYLCFDIRT